MLAETLREKAEAADKTADDLRRKDGEWFHAIAVLRARAGAFREAATLVEKEGD
jgi:hypothetical protein